MATSFTIEKLTDKVDFTMWKHKMERLLEQQGLHQALQLDEGFPKDFDEAEKKRIIGKARSTVVLSLGDATMREVIK